MHITDTHTKICKPGRTLANLISKVLSSYYFFLLQIHLTPRSLETVGGGWVSLSNSQSLLVPWGPGHPGLGMSVMCNRTSCPRSTVRVQRTRGWWQPRCYSRRRAPLVTAERSSRSESQEHSCPRHYPLARMSLPCSALVLSTLRLRAAALETETWATGHGGPELKVLKWKQIMKVGHRVELIIFNHRHLIPGLGRSPGEGNGNPL